MKLYEAGPAVGANLRDWGHVRVFTPWRYCVDAAATALLERQGWRAPAAEAFPTGAELVAHYLEPLAQTPELAAVHRNRRPRHRDLAPGRRQGRQPRARERGPSCWRSTAKDGIRRDLARAVIDASGTWATPNPLGASGLPAEGEAAFADRIAYGIPDILGRDRDLYAGRDDAGRGIRPFRRQCACSNWRSSRMTEPRTSLPLGDARHRSRADLRRRRCRPVAGARRARRGCAGARRKRARDAGDRICRLALHERTARLIVEGETAEGRRRIGPVDRIIAATGQRPDLSLTRELRLDLDPWLESAKALGPLIDPNLHSCGVVPPHGHRELAHPEPGFYTVGIKSYGRAPTFLLLTGYEQVRSVAAAIAGDMAAADDVRLVLPETGVCSTRPVIASG